MKNELKIILLGDSGVGKSSMLQLFKDKKNYNKNDPLNLTIGIDFYTFPFFVQNKKQTVMIYDTSGSERFQSITQSYYRNAMCCILVYDVTNVESYEHVELWSRTLDQFTSNVPIILVGNKNDHVERPLYAQEGYKLAVKLNADFYELNTLEYNSTLEKVFHTAIYNAYQHNQQKCQSVFSIHLPTKKDTTTTTTTTIHENYPCCQ